MEDIVEQEEFGVKGTPFAMIPAWVLEADIPATAKVVYAGLQGFVSGREGDCVVRRSALAARVGVSTRTVGNSLRALVGIGAVRVQQRRSGKRQYASRYVVVFDCPREGGVLSAPEPEPEPQAPASGKDFPSHPEWRRYAAAFRSIGKEVGRFSAQAWLRFVQQDGTSPKAIDARAALAADCAEQYVKDLRHERRGFDVAKGYAKSAENFLAEGVWEAHRPRPEVPQPEPGEAVEDRSSGEAAPEVPFEEKHADYARAAAGDEAAVEALRRVLPSRFFEAPAGVPARWPGLIGVLGLRESFTSTAEDRAAFARAAGEGVSEPPRGTLGGPGVTSSPIHTTVGSTARKEEANECS